VSGNAAAMKAARAGLTRLEGYQHILDLPCVPQPSRPDIIVAAPALLATELGQAPTSLQIPRPLTLTHPPPICA
jgi:hypothetical protein